MYQGLNQFDTQRKMFAGKPAKDHYQKGYLPMQKFFGQKIYQSLSATRKNRYRDRYKKNPRNNAWDFEANVEAIIEWYLEGLSQKTQFYLLKYFSFIYTKEQWKDEMAYYWMLCNINNDHPYLDIAYKSDPIVRRLEHESGDGSWFWDRFHWRNETLVQVFVS